MQKHSTGMAHNRGPTWALCKGTFMTKNILITYKKLLVWHTIGGHIGFVSGSVSLRLQGTGELETTRDLPTWGHVFLNKELTKSDHSLIVPPGYWHIGQNWVDGYTFLFAKREVNIHLLVCMFLKCLTSTGQNIA